MRCHQAGGRAIPRPRPSSSRKRAPAGGLEEYRRKRRFEVTPEPEGKVEPPAGGLRFVIQEHHARRFHHDFRLEMEGVLRSWALPKGISLDPADKRLAVAVEDHPLDYIDFEGVIPQGNYGAGTVMVWDRGAYTCKEGDPDPAYQQGKLTITLHGQKVSGEFHLVRTRMPGRGRAAAGRSPAKEGGDGTQWLLFKGRDASALSGWTLPKVSRSVKTGRTIEEIASDESAQWSPRDGDGASGARGQRRAPASARTRDQQALRRLGVASAGTDPFPHDIHPMLARLVDEPFDSPGWLFEVKWDGVRTVAYLRRQGPERSVVLQSRNLNVVNRQYPEIVEALHALDLPDAVLDGEIVAPDEQGRPSFQRLQQRINLQRPEEVAEIRPRVPLAYYVFDILSYNGHSLLRRPLRERRQILEAVLPQHPIILTSHAFTGEGTTFYRAAGEQRLEGIVGKRADSLYEPGKRSGAWVKIKVRKTLHAVVGGYTQGRQRRRGTLGAILLGLYDARGALQPIGHAGSGFTDAALKDMLDRLRPLEQARCPFAVIPRTNEPPTWVRPEIVVQVEYTEWTDEGSLRAPVFKGFEPGVPPHDCRLEEVRPFPAPDETQVMHEGAGATLSGGVERPRRPSTDSRTAQRRPRPGGELTPLEAEVRRRGLRVDLTNLEKVFWPAPGLTKADLIAYYLSIHEAILPHLRDRPLTLRRFPDGIDGEAFYQKDYPDAPPFVETIRLWTETTKTTNNVVVCNNLATLVWLGQIGCIETHAWYSRITPMKRGEGSGGKPAHTDFASSEEARSTSVLNYPDQLVFDIDPFIFPAGEGPRKGPGEKDPEYSRAGFEAAVEAAFLVRKVLEGLGLRLFVKTTGKTGIHIYVPLARRHTYEETHTFAKTVCQFLEGQYPDRLTTEWAVERRVGKVFLDYNQNRLEATLAGPYSLRPSPHAAVSTPVTWEELRRGVDPLSFTWETVPRRVKTKGDPWKEMSGIRQTLEGAIKKAGR